MSKKVEHRLGVSEVNLVVRHMRLEPIEQVELQEAIAEIDKFYGLDTVTFDEKSHVLKLTYDASRISLDGIEGVLKQHNVKFSHDWLTHFKEGHYKFVDQNVKDNASHESWSCRKRPPGR